MLQGYAVGGPRAGVKLSAASSWDGSIVAHRTEKLSHYFDGHYVWCSCDALADWHWCWRDSLPAGRHQIRPDVHPERRKYP